MIICSTDVRSQTAVGSFALAADRTKCCAGSRDHNVYSNALIRLCDTLLSNKVPPGHCQGPCINSEEFAIKL